MIIGWLIQIAYNFISGIISIFPTDTLGIPTGFTTGLNLVVSYLHSWSWLLPVDQLIAALIFVIGVQIVVLLIKLTKWVIRSIRG
jgi:hypothetical protein